MVTEPPTPEHHERTVYADFSLHPVAGEGEHPDPAGPVIGASTQTFVGSVGSPQLASYCPVPLFENLHVLAPLPAGETRADLALQAEHMAHAAPESLDPFDLPERERMYGCATTFVTNHVRRVRSGQVILAKEHVFPDGTLVVSEKAIPRLPFRLVRLNWAVKSGRVVDLHGQRVFAFRLRRFTPPERRFLWAPGKGDSFDVAYLLGNLCAILGLRLPEPVAATGVVALATNQLLGGGRLELQRDGAAEGGIRHLILPFAAHLMPGLHEGVRYWPARDVNEAAFSLLAAASADLAIPDLKRRWRVKMAVSWISLLAMLLCIGAFQLAGYFDGNPLLIEWTLGVSGGFLVLSCWATRKYHRIDR